ncbi:MAG: hypothetical protein QF535_12275 [Anaerolineales bacterium]|jgi:hypothetical protein|nr:hypothetical protein [Anaerolineales bacterium]|tara:strand:- start:1076 stop:1294 length:219 start_codon:yes stop_codon:yes gene_type:complete
MAIEKTDLPGYVKDTESKAVINTNIKALEAYKKKRNNRKEQDQIAEDIKEMKSDIGDIKRILQEMLTNGSNN